MVEEYANASVVEFGAIIKRLCDACVDRPQEMKECQVRNCLAYRLKRHIEAILNPNTDLPPLPGPFKD